MSHTIRPHSCETIREMVYNYRRGELSEVDAALFEDTISSCPSCGRYARRVISMLDAADEVSPEDYIGQPLSPSYEDDLFASILSGISAPLESSSFAEAHASHLDDASTPLTDDAVDLPEPILRTAQSSSSPSSAVVRLDDYMRGTRPLATAHASDLEGDDEDSPTLSAKTPRLGWFLAAAAILTAIGATYWAVHATSTVQPPEQRAGGSVEMAQKSRDIKYLKSLDKMRFDATTPDAIKVFASQGASWSIEGDAPDYTLHLDQGTILVEFLPTKRERLKVVSHQTSVDVVGTVFYVAANEDSAQDDAHNARVGVLTGKVRVKPSPATPVVELEDGQQLQEDARISSVPEAAFERSRHMIDLDAHRAILAARQEKRSEIATGEVPDNEPEQTPQKPRRADARKLAPDAPREVTAPISSAPRIDTLKKEATHALREKDYAHAARKIEQLLAIMPDAHPERATFRLELARLYMRHSGKRQHAIDQLRIFIAEHPTDVAAPSARRQLCRLLGPESTRETECILPVDL